MWFSSSLIRSITTILILIPASATKVLGLYIGSLVTLSNSKHKKRSITEQYNNVKDESKRFELLSAYIDGEVTSKESRMIKYWLDTDPNFNKSYKALLRIKRETFIISTPVSIKSKSAFSQDIFDKIDRQQRKKFNTILGSLGTMVMIFSGIWLQDGFIFHHYVQKNENQALTIALNRPVLEIPNTRNR
ncbi:hypothetical protein CPARK_000075500 [cyanobacterium endosymbiont of Braarudosphaera bigelowii]|uniref:Uncharacterized protein n=1 Tax=cyanobacterium endosymbiont of Braarudosphaera bigelowii TaxID=1285375 RepID=A0ABM7U5A6_9CHRO|nr:hypothetical protein CPARK_000075500 [cyanobacterium endosymbiont of Braarudosphaera bigelowii]